MKTVVSMTGIAVFDCIGTSGPEMKAIRPAIPPAETPPNLPDSAPQDGELDQGGE